MKRFNVRCDTNPAANPSCERCPNADLRHTDKKTGMCLKIKSVADGLPMRCVGDWANDKIYYLLQYFQIFAKSMHKKWNELRYVEVCSGPGRCCTRDGREQDGTALAIVRNEQFELLSDAIFIDYSDKVVDVLTERFQRLGKGDKAHAVVGDYNDQTSIVETLAKHSPTSLTLCFIDPTDCSLPFETVRSIFAATRGKCDFLISFFDGLDYNRNALNVMFDDSYSNLRDKYSRFLGTTEYFTRNDVIDAAREGNNDRLVQLFRNQYADQLKAMGLVYQDWKSVKNYYKLLFASKHPKALTFWKEASKSEPDGQRQLNLGI